MTKWEGSKETWRVFSRSFKQALNIGGASPRCLTSIMTSSSRTNVARAAAIQKHI